MGITDPEIPEDLDLVIRSQIDAWLAELEVLVWDPRLRKFTALQEKVDKADPFIVDSLGDGGIVWRPKRLGVPDNELSSFKADDLEDIVVRPPQAGSG